MDQNQRVSYFSGFLFGLLSLFIVGALVVFTTLESRQSIKSGVSLPKGSTNIIVVGQDWYEFDYKGQHFLYHRYKLVNDMSECLAVINSPDSSDSSNSLDSSD